MYALDVLAHLNLRAEREERARLVDEILDAESRLTGLPKGDPRVYDRWAWKDLRKRLAVLRKILVHRERLALALDAACNPAEPVTLK